jgi:hypothetical protein
MAKRHRAISMVAIAALIAAPIAANAQGLALKGGFGWNPAPNSGGAYPGELSAHNSGSLGLALTTGGLFGVGVEGLWAERGFNSTTAGASRRLAYIDVPAYLRITAQNEGVVPFGYAGPQVAFEVRCNGGGGNCPEDRKKVEYSGVVGAGLRFGTPGISVEARYVYGLTNLHLSTVTESESYRTRSFLLLAGFGF